MPLPIPQLDDRTFADLVEEARARIPRYTPEWTNYNESDPGIVLLQLQAWLTETVLYRLNRLPELNYLKFLELLNVAPHPAVAARAQLTFTLKKLNQATDPLVVLVPKNSQIGVDDPDLTQELVFETDRTLTALNATVAAVAVPGAGDSPWDLVTAFDDKTRTTSFLRAFYPFGTAPAVGVTCLIGILLRPHQKEGVNYDLDRFPEGELDLTAFVPEVFETDADGETIAGPQGLDCLFPWQVTAQAETIAWEVYAGNEHAAFPAGGDWRSLGLPPDETAALSRSGHVYLNVPGGVPGIRFAQLSRAFWADLNLTKYPTAAQELVDDIESGFLFPADVPDSIWADLGLEDIVLDDPANPVVDQIEAAAAAGTLNMSGVDETAWVDADLGYDASPVPYPLTWFRARLLTVPESPPQVSQFLLNTVPATAAVTRSEETVGTSDGRPNQTYALSKTPVLVDPATGLPTLVLEVGELGAAVAWTLVPDFYATDADDAVYTLDPDGGTITFGDGRHGRIPVAGSPIVAHTYRYGGGAVGNAGAGTITALKSALPNVSAVANVRAAAGGADAESLDDVLLRAPHDLRMRERAVTGEDFAQLALQTPGVRIQRAYALPLTRADLAQTPPALMPDSPGAVTVVILPENKDDTPQPTEDQLRLVCAHLNGRRLITTELYVVGPRYLEIARLRAEVTAGRDVDLKALHDALTATLHTYFHPLTGGEDGAGWPFGGDVYFGNVYRQVLGVAGVRRVLCLEITPQGADEPCPDVLTVPDGNLVYLPATALELKVSYDPTS